jgi:hypothetical protein
MPDDEPDRFAWAKAREIAHRLADALGRLRLLLLNVRSNRKRSLDQPKISKIERPLPAKSGSRILVTNVSLLKPLHHCLGLH